MADRPNSSSPTPRWVKAFGITGVVLVVMFVTLHLSGHGFGHHMHMSVPGPGVQRP